MTPPFPSLEVLLFPYVEVAAFMVGINLYLLRKLLPKPRPSPDLATVVLVVGFLVVGLSFWGAVIFSVLDPGDASTVAVFLAANSMMAVLGSWLLALFFRAEERRLSGARWGWPLLLGAMFVGNELLMGTAFAMAIQGPAAYMSPGSAGVVAAVTDGVVSVWFFGAMFVTMVAFLLFLPLPRFDRQLLLGFSATSLIGPAIVVAALPAAFAMGAVMAAVLLYALRPLAAPEALSPEYPWLLGGVLLGFGAMGGGALLALLDPAQLGGAFPFALATLLVMGGEFVALTRWAFTRGGLARAEGAATGGSVPAPTEAGAALPA